MCRMHFRMYGCNHKDDLSKYCENSTVDDDGENIPCDNSNVENPSITTGNKPCYRKNCTAKFSTWKCCQCKN